jgi:hypothetical protein
MLRRNELVASCNQFALGVQATKAAALAYLQEGEAAAIAGIPRMRERPLASDDFREGLASFVERRAARFRGR